MKRITFNNIQKWIRASKKPLENDLLENFQEKYFGEKRHEYYRFFYHMSAEMKPKIALEIGVHFGHTAIHMAHASPETLVIGIDIRVDRIDMQYRPANCIFVHKDSLSDPMWIKEFVNQRGPIGIVFQDSSHHYEASHKEFENYSQFLGKNAIWCCDDVREDFHDPLVDPPGKNMATYFNELPGRKKTYEDLHHGSVIGVALL